MDSTRLSKGRVAAWALYDFANSPYSTIMTTVGFPLVFTQIVAPGRSGPLLWGLLYGVSQVAAGVLAPGLGAWSDGVGRRRPFLVAFALTAIGGTALCALVGPGDLWMAVFFFGLANMGFACANVFYNALLVEVAPREKRDTVSGIGWGTGYIGGLLALVLCEPLYRDGVAAGTLGKVHASFLVVAGIFLLFSLPIFFLRERSGPAPGGAKGLGEAYARVWRTLKEIRRYANLFHYLLANFFFNDGIHAVILFASVFGTKALGLEAHKIYLLFIALQIVGAAGAFAAGWLADRVGSRRMLLILVGSWAVLVGTMASVQTFAGFAAAGAGAGLLLGATQSVARGFLSKIAPKEQEGEFFGFFGLCGKFSSFIGPVIFGGVSSLTGNMRLGALSLVPLFLVGFFLLLKVEDPSKKPDGGERGNGETEVQKDEAN